MTVILSQEKVSESTRSIDTASTAKSRSSTPHLMSASVHENLIQIHHKVDPLEFYIIEAVLGEGSMGYVARVQKKDSVRGGSARPEFVANHRHLHRPPWNQCCFPSLFSFCLKNNERIPNMKGTFIDIDRSTTSRTTDLSSLSSSGLETNNPKVLLAQRSRSTLITYGTKKESHYALKSIILDRCSTPEFKEELKNEVEILKGLDHPNIVRALETFDFQGRLYIVMELCGGRDLYSRDPYSEDEARTIMVGLNQAVSYLHSKGIVHRDLKYENIMFTDNTRNAEVKLIDFGLSQKFASGEHLHDTVGTVYTMAPELIQGDYDSKADMWSLGVIAFMLLSSSMPFYGESRSAVVEQILHGKYRFQSKRWQQVSDDAKFFVKSLLRRRPEKRPTASDVLQESPWLCKVIRNDSTQTDLELMDTVQASIQAFSSYKTLKKLALLVVAYKSTNEEIGFLRKMFSKFDATNDGEISYEEFRAALLENYDYTDEEMQDMFDGIDIDGTGNVHYMEFLAATIEAHGSIDEERLAESFDRLDADDSGVISVQNLKDFLGDNLADAYLEGIISEAHDNTAPAITYEEFLGLWDMNADEQIKCAKIVVGSRRVKHMKSALSTVSSFISEDDDDDVFLCDPSHEQMQVEISSKKSGSCFFQDHREMSIRKVATGREKYCDV